MKALITIIVLALIGWGIFAMMSKNEVESPVPTNDQAQNDSSPSTGSEQAGSIELATQEFTVDGKNLSFLPNTITVNKGDKIKITFVNEAGTHDFVLDGYNVRTKVLQSGQSESVEFIADKAGTFEYYCSVGTHRQMGMKGTLIVK